MKILFICTANVCRSPLAEGYLKSLLQEYNKTDVEVASAGVAALVRRDLFGFTLNDWQAA